MRRAQCTASQCVCWPLVVVGIAPAAASRRLLTAVLSCLCRRRCVASWSSGGKSGHNGSSRYSKRRRSAGRDGRSSRGWQSRCRRRQLLGRVLHPPRWAHAGQLDAMPAVSAHGKRMFGTPSCTFCCCEWLLSAPSPLFGTPHPPPTLWHAGLGARAGSAASNAAASAGAAAPAA